MNIVFIFLKQIMGIPYWLVWYNKLTSPYMDQIAAQGVLFERAYAADIPTEVAHTGIFAGKVGYDYEG
jgi:arylsulfatase